MLENAIKKARILKSGSFVTWNGAEAVIWGVDTEHYSVETLTKIKVYPKVPTITVRDDLSDPAKYALHESELKERALDILHELDQLYRSGHLKKAIDISDNIISAVQKAGETIMPQFHKEIDNLKGESRHFREEFNKWKIYESSTLRILGLSSRRKEQVIPEQVLAKFTFYNLIGKILFYMTLSENLSGELDPIDVTNGDDVKSVLSEYFERAMAIDYQAIFRPYFTDEIDYSEITSGCIVDLLRSLKRFDFRILPVSVVGHILENLVPSSEKQKFGQYFTPEILANLVSFPVVQTKNDVLFDPTSGTGTFLESFYRIKRFYGNTDHADLLNQIWGNDVSHFPAILSVINLYKQDVTETDNFPRVVRDDFFNLEVGQKIAFPDPHNHDRHVDVELPLFDGIASNFPFIQQEDIPGERLNLSFERIFRKSQRAFLKDNTFKINERSDYFTFCIYNSIRFLKPNGILSAVTSNAWLGKEYGLQFKRFLLDNFHIKYVVKSSAEHWFKSSQVSTVFLVLERKRGEEPTRFVTIKEKLECLFGGDNVERQLVRIEDFYAEVDNCDDKRNEGWTEDEMSEGLFHKKDGTADVCIVSKKTLSDSIAGEVNWNEYFVSSDLFSCFGRCVKDYFPDIVDVFRGERTGCNPMFIIKDGSATGVSEKYLVPCVKNTRNIDGIVFNGNYGYSFFVCNESVGSLDSGTRAWIEKFENRMNRNSSMTVSQSCRSHRPYWYSLNPKLANIIITINPYERYFFVYSERPFAIDQRMIAMTVKDGYDVELVVALLNSAITYLFLEMRGTARNLGALDLNADTLKRLRTLNPDLLSAGQKRRILAAFAPLKERPVGEIAVELTRRDRMDFDKTVFECYGLSPSLCSYVYSLLGEAVALRVGMKTK